MKDQGEWDLPVEEIYRRAKEVREQTAADLLSGKRKPARGGKRQPRVKPVKKRPTK